LLRAVHRADIDGAFERVGERVERADEIVQRDAEIAGEVVTRPGRDADEGQSVRQRGRRDDRQRSVSARHPERVGAAGCRSLGELLEVVAGGQDHRLDATFTCRLVEARVAGLAAAGQRIDEQHRPLRGPGAQPAGLRHLRHRHVTRASHGGAAWATRVQGTVESESSRRLLLAALAAFARRGFQAATTREIGELALTEDVHRATARRGPHQTPPRSMGSPVS
jgi:hypothetical protein